MNSMLRNIRIENCGGHAMYVGSGVAVDVDGFTAINNDGDGIHFEDLHPSVAVAVSNIPEPNRSKALSLLAAATPSFISDLTLSGLKSFLGNFGIDLP